MSTSTRRIGRAMVAVLALLVAVPSASGLASRTPHSATPSRSLPARPAMFMSNGPATDQVTAHDAKFWLGGQQIKLRGINIVPSLDGSYPSDADFAQVASWGMNVVRLRIRWKYLEPTAPQPVGSSWLHTYDSQQIAYIQSMIASASSHGIYTMVENACGPPCMGDWWPNWLYESPYNSHHLDYTDADQAATDYWSDQLMQRFTSDFLKYVAGQLAASPGVVGYEVLNEPAQGSLPNASATTATLLGVTYAMAQAVRQADPPRVVFFMTRGCCGEGVPNADFSQFVTLGNVAFDVHDYYGARWGAGLLMDPAAPDYGEVEQMVNRFTLNGVPYLGTTTVQEQIVKNFKSFLDPNGIPLFIGEFSGDPPDEPNTANVMGTMTSAFNDQGVSWALYEYTGRFGILQENGSLQPWGQIVIDAAKAP
jgi:Cellulase (glycosyl hydrolase family 5)